MKKVKKSRFGGITEGVPTEATTYNVSYKVSNDDGMTFDGTIKVTLVGTRETAGKRVHKKLAQRWPNAGISIRQIWEPGHTPSGLVLPQGCEWVDDEVGGKKQNP